MATQFYFVSYPAFLAGSGGGGGGSVGTEIQEFDGPAGGTMTGVRNGVNVTFTVSHLPKTAAQFKLYIDGTILVQGVDYAINIGTGVITMTVAPLVSQTLLADYFY
jgi:hypothetical protein